MNVTPKTLVGWHLAGKLGIQISPRTVRKYMPKPPLGQPRGDQRWLTFVHNHASAVVACDFLTVVTATFRCLYVFVVMEVGRRKLQHINVTDHPTAPPTAAWTLQQLREAIPSDHTYQYLLHDRDHLTRLDAAMIGWVNGEEIGCLSVLEVAYEVVMQRRLVAFDGEVVMGKALGNQGSQRACAALIRHRP